MGLSYVPVIATGRDVEFNDLSVSGTLDVVGAATFGTDITVVGTTNVNDLEVTGTATFNGNSNFNTMSVTGTSSMGEVLAANISATQLSVSNPSGGTDGVTVKTDADTQPRLSLDSDGTIALGPGNAATDTTLLRSGVGALSTPGFFAMGSGQSGGNFSVFGTSLILGTAGGGIRIAEGSNARMGVATLVAGTVVVANTSVTANTRIQLTIQSLGTVTTPKAIGVTARTAATSFTITSADATDTSVIAWELKEPA
jgi:hypothetical protein